MSFVSVVFCQVEVSCVERSPTECGVSECDREASIARRPLLTRGFAPWGGGRTMFKKIFTIYFCIMMSRINVLVIHSFTVPYMRCCRHYRHIFAVNIPQDPNN